MSRRAITVALVVSLVLAGSVGVTAQHSGDAAPVSATANVPPPDTYVVEQGDHCREIEPLRSNGTVESFYDYRNHETHPEGVDRMYSSYGTTDLQADDTSLLFLHEGTDGVSLVMVHDRLEGETAGGIATFDVVGLPAEAEWVVQDDRYDGESNMAEWYRGDGWARANWIWAEERTDGGAIRGGLNGEFAVTIRPAFNEDAEFADAEDLYDPEFHDDGEIEEWDVVSGGADDPERTTLPSLDEPVTIRTGTCDGPSVTYDRTDDGIAATVGNADADDRVVLQSTAGTNDSVRFDRVELTGLEDDGTITFENRHPDGVAASPDGVESLSSLTVTGDPAFESATVTFHVDAELLETRDVDPEAVALYERSGDGWSESPTTLREDAGGTYTYTAEVSSLDGLTVAPQQPEEDDAYPSAGFGIGVVLVAAAILLGTWSVRRDR